MIRKIGGGRTVWAQYIRHIGVVGQPPRPEIDAGGTAEGNGAEVLIVGGSLIDDVLLQVGHVIDTVHLEILVIGENKDDVRLLGGAILLPGIET